jgi:Ca2+/Na+ antiporter
MANIINDISGFVASFARSNPTVFFGVLAILVFLVYRRPKFFLAVLFLGLLLAGVVYIIMEAASSGVSKKERLIHKDAPAENIFRPPDLKL